MTERIQSKTSQTCDGKSEHLTALLDNELTPADAAVLRAHLAECTPCREECEALAAVRGIAAQWTVEPGSDLWPRIQAEIEPADLVAVQAELRQLRTETQALRQELAQLHQELAARPPQPATPRVLFPYSPAPSAASQRIV